jgi:superfamily I DNA/RNA helicase
MISQMRDYLMEQYNHTGDFLAAIQALKGEDTIPIMNTHKSKGLEFHTVIFVGLEDSAFWNYHKQPTSDNNTFFVALSRAKERVLFTFCHQRPLPKNGGQQKAEAINAIHELIKGYHEVVVLDLHQPDMIADK